MRVSSANLIGTLASALTLSATDIIDTQDASACKSAALHAVTGEPRGSLMRSAFAG